MNILIAIQVRVTLSLGSPDVFKNVGELARVQKDYEGKEAEKD